MLRSIKYNCHQATLLSIKKERMEISFKERLMLRWHLMYCGSCRQFVAQSQIINKALNEMDNGIFNKPAFALSEDFKAALKRKIQDSKK